MMEAHTPKIMAGWISQWVKWVLLDTLGLSRAFARSAMFMAIMVVSSSSVSKYLFACQGQSDHSVVTCLTMQLPISKAKAHEGLCNNLWSQKGAALSSHGQESCGEILLITSTI